MRNRILVALGFLSAAIIAFQLTLMQVLSIAQWYHFAYMVISVALLGFGAAGTLLSISRDWFLQRFEKSLAILMAGCGITMAMVMGISQMSIFRFDTYLLFADFFHIFRLLFTYLLIFLPFFLGALAIGLIFIKYVESIGKIYFVNMVGSGLGGIAALVLLWFFEPNELPAIIAVLAVVASIIVIPRFRSFFGSGLVLLSIIILCISLVYSPKLVPSQFKSISKPLNLPDAKVDLERNSPFGQLQVVSSPALRYAPGLSLNYLNDVPSSKAVFNNGNWYGAIIPAQRTDTTSMMAYSTKELPFVLKPRNRILALQSGAGIDVLHSLTHGPKHIVAVESNPDVISLLRNELAFEMDSLFYHPSLSIHNVSPRTFLLSDLSKFDLIILPMIGAFGGTSGIFAVQEQYLLTKEAFSEMWNKLTPSGVISVSCYIDYPILNPLKIFSTIIEVLEDFGIEKLMNHIVAVRSWSTITFVIKKSEINVGEIKHARDFCQEMLFDPVLLPNIRPEERAQFNALQDDRLFRYIDEILSSNRREFYSNYDFNLKPATDQRPYFSQFIKLQSLPKIGKIFGFQSIPFFELGYLIIIVTFIQITALALFLIILPLFKISLKQGSKIPIFLYFGGIGLGYIFVEIVLIQKFLLYFDNAIYSAAIVIAAMLTCSGIGSYVSSKLKLTRKVILIIFGFVIMILVLYAVLLTPVILSTITLNFNVKLLFGFLFIAPLAFLMGFPFPLGLQLVAKNDRKGVPWAWGINGSVSVVSTVLATLIAIEIGFIWVIILAAGAYCFPVLATMRFKLT